MIRLEGVSKRYPSKAAPVNALDGVNLEIGKGQFVVVRGPSGCGKTTLLMAMAGILAPTCGSVEIDGNDLYALSGAKRNKIRARYFGFVFQMFHLVPYLNIVDNVTLAGPAAGNGADKVRAKGLLADLGLVDRFSHRPSQLSSGEKQRVALARALFNNPPILIADEPTGNLDSGNAAAVYDCFAKFHGQGGTVVVVTHDGRADLGADREFRMEKSRLHEESR